MEVIKITGEHITLMKFLKYVGETSAGGEIEHFLENNTVTIDGNKPEFKRQKHKNNTILKINEKEYKIETK